MTLSPGDLRSLKTIKESLGGIISRMFFWKKISLEKQAAVPLALIKSKGVCQGFKLLSSACQ